MSGDTNVRTVPCAWLSTIAKPVAAASVRSGSSTTSSMRAGPGASATRRRHELVGRLVRALDLDEDTPRVVADVAGQTELGGQAVHVGPEPDALDQAGHAEAEADRRLRRGHAGHAGDPLRRPSVTAASRCIRPKL